MIGRKKSVKSKNLVKKSRRSRKLKKSKPKRKSRKSRKSKSKGKLRKSKSKGKSRKSKLKRKSKKSSKRIISNYLIFNKLKNNNYQKGLYENDRYDINKINLHSLDQLGGMQFQHEFKSIIQGLKQQIYDEASHNLSVLDVSDRMVERHFEKLLQRMLDLIIQNNEEFIHVPDFMGISSDNYYEWAGGFDEFNSIITPEGKKVGHRFGDKILVDHKINMIQHAINNHITPQQLIDRIKQLHEASNKALYNYLKNQLNNDMLGFIKNIVYNEINE